MKTFDWESYKKVATPVKYAWLKKKHTMDITEKEYVVIQRSFKKQSIHKVNGKGNKQYWQKHYSPSFLKRQYRKLKEDFGFFT